MKIARGNKKIFSKYGIFGEMGKFFPAPKIKLDVATQYNYIRRMDVTYSTEYGNFEWDSEKEAINLKKHGIAFRLACEVFADDHAVHIYDKKHSMGEHRWILIGECCDGTLLLNVVYVDRQRVRIISSRLATKEERRDYASRYYG